MFTYLNCVQKDTIDRCYNIPLLLLPIFRAAPLHHKDICVITRTFWPLITHEGPTTSCSSDPSIKVLGIVLDNKLKFDEHVSQMCLKASRQINALKRISKYLDQKCRILVYKSFISSNFNYCPVSWMFCGKMNLNKLEKLQERALRCVFHDSTSPYETLLERGNFLSLSVYRAWCLAIEVFKCVRGNNPAYLNNLFKQSNLKYDLRDSSRLEQPKFHTFTYGLRSFHDYGSKLWNILPHRVKNTKDMNVFKKNITEWCHSRQCIALDVF